MTDDSRLKIPQYIEEIDPYIPGKPIEEVERELGLTAVKLASNENPLGPSPLAVEAARRALAESHRYPDGGSYYLREALAARLDVPREKIIVGSGSTDIIHLAASVLLGAGESAVTSQGSFPLYYIAIEKMGANLIAVPQKNYAFDLDGIARAVQKDTKIIYIANPNNPTGSIFDADAFDTFLQKIPEEILVVLDEAYYEYVEMKNYSRSLDLVRANKNVLVLRTFSKVYGLAGLRVGYGIGPVELIGAMDKIRLPFPVSGVAQAAALAALDDTEHVKRSLEANRAGLRQLENGLREIGVKFAPSVTNFVLVEVGGDADALAGELLKLGVIVRPMAWMGFPHAIRVTVGTREENEKFLNALQQLKGTVAAGKQNG
ncbi:MAG TPA: histidinol-phosphate transaminase [Candidatus Acidoferrales bacterium]|nr:histidinol-phosphate transaminase [Candidatus Acidoferrales bacterium]